MSNPQSVKEYLEAHADADPKAVLEIALAETERVRADTERLKQQYKADNEVPLGPDGFEVTNFAQLQRLAQVYAASQMVPESYRRRPADCAIALATARKLKIDDLSAFWSIYVVHGRPGMMAQLLIALLNRSKVLDGPLQFEFGGNGDGYGCCAVGSIKGKRVVGPTVDRKMVRAEGWDKDKKGQPSKWATMSDVMFRYRAAALFVRTVCPEIQLGIQTVEELEDIGDGRLASGDTLPPNDLDELKKQLDAEDQPAELEPSTEIPSRPDAPKDDEGGMDAPPGDEGPAPWDSPEYDPPQEADDRGTEAPRTTTRLLTGMEDRDRENH